MRTSAPRAGGQLDCTLQALRRLLNVSLTNCACSGALMLRVLLMPCRAPTLSTARTGPHAGACPYWNTCRTRHSRHSRSGQYSQQR